MGDSFTPLFRKVDRRLLMGQWLLAPGRLQVARAPGASTLGMRQTRSFSNKPFQPRRPRSSRRKR